MLQFITNATDRFSIAEQTRLVIEGGCRWIQLRMKDATYDEMRSTALDIIPLCRDNGVIMVIDDNVELVKELRVHGVHLGKKDMPAAEAREMLGPHAIIGVTANTANDILAFKGIDVDYVGLGPLRYTTTKANLSPTIGIDGYCNIMRTIRSKDIELPVVAIGSVDIDDIDPLIIDAGVDGVAVSGAILRSPFPKTYTQQLIERLECTAAHRRHS